MFIIFRNILTALMLAWFTWTDLRSHTIWWPGAAGAGAAGIILRLAFSEPLADSLWGLLVGAFLMAASHFCREAIGKGDCWAIAGCGALLGFAGVFELVFTAVLFAAVWSVFLLIRHRDLKQRFAFMPFLLAAWVCQVPGQFLMINEFS